VTRAQSTVTIALVAAAALATGALRHRADAAAAAVPVAALGVAPRVHPEGPPAAYTGGFGEPTCTECHFDADVNAGPGTLALDGVPATIAAGSTHTLTVRLTHAGQLRAGFMLSARTAAGVQAGTLAPADACVTITHAGDVAYAHHTLPGTELTGEERTWTVRWTADAVSPGTDVVFHLVGNATNDDASPFGDFVYATNVTVRVE
jgi:hypothetical protein